MKSPKQADEKLLSLARGVAKLSAASFAENKLPGRWMVCTFRGEPEFDGEPVYLLNSEHPDVDYGDPDVPLPGWPAWDRQLGRGRG